MIDLPYVTIERLHKRIDLVEMDRRQVILKYQRLENGRLTPATEDEIKHEYEIQKRLSLSDPEKPHPHICRPHALIERETGIGTLHAIAMDYLGKETLDDHVKNGGYKTVNERVPILLGVAKALKHAHDNQTVYCDLRPGNIMAVDGRGVLIDWDGARIMNYDGPLKEAVYRSIAITEDTVAPELIKQGILIPQNDIFSLGVTAFLTLAQRHPFEITEEGTIEYEFPEVTPLTLEQLHFSRRLSQTMYYALERFYNNRPTMDEIITALEKEIDEQERKFKIQLARDARYDTRRL